MNNSKAAASLRVTTEDKNDHTPTRRRAIIYCRVSTDKQEQDGESLEYQEAKGRQYAELHDMEVVTVLHEIKSGFIHYSHREQLTLARQLIRDHIADTMIVWDLRRFSRNFVHSAMIFEELERHGGEIISVSENIDNSLTGKLIRSILAWSAESEREKIVEYANRRWRTRLEQGLPVGVGYAPYGWNWQDEGKTAYEINREEAAVRFSIFHMYVELDMSLRGIVHKLEEDNIPSPTQTRFPGAKRSQHWTHTTVYDFLHNPISIGTLVICRRQTVLDEQGRTKRVPHPQRIEIEDAVPAIVSRTMFERAQRKLANNQVDLSHLPQVPEAFLLRGHIRCGTCEWKMSSWTIRRKNYLWPYYYCSNRHNKYAKCPDIPAVRAGLVNEIVWEECCKVFERIDRIQARIDQELERTVRTLLEDTHGREQMVGLKARIDHAITERGKHPEGSYYYELITEDLQVKKEQLERYEAQYTNSRSLAEMTERYRQRVADFLEFINVMRGRYHEATFQEKRNAIDVLGVMVTVAPIPPEKRLRGKDPTIEELRSRLSITYSPLLTGVQPSVEGRPQNQ
ncbi:MAG TPA: recombinase family protein [Ktedonobacteraceae bacterium]|nr:recombinase family protein [Ktedonobacteraceae bacterium]